MGAAHGGYASLDPLAHEAVVVLGDETVDAALEQDAQHGVEGVVSLAEVNACAAVAEALDAVPPGRL